MISWKSKHSAYKLRQFYFLRNFISNKLLNMLYFSLCHSRLSYAIANWEGTDNVTLNLIKVTQNNFPRIISIKPKHELELPVLSDCKFLFVINYSPTNIF